MIFPLHPAMLPRHEARLVELEAQFDRAFTAGMTLWTPYLRAIQFAADTTPRFSGVPPTMTGLPTSSGRSRFSTETK